MPAACFDVLTLAGLHTLGRRLGGRPLAQAFVFAYLLYPHAAAVARPILAAALALLALSPMSRPPVQDARQHAALAAALLIGAQLLLGYWFYNYLIWFYPLLLVAVIQPPARRNAKMLTSIPALGLITSRP